MPELIVYATSHDGESIRDWINDDREVAWIVKTSEKAQAYGWRAQSRIERLLEQEYAIWHIESGPLIVPSGVVNTSDQLVEDPFVGWTQTLDRTGATAPWFGGNLPGPYLFRFRESGKEGPTSLGRSGFYWALDRFNAVGKPAHPYAKRWWNRLKRFVATHATEVGWPSPATASSKAFVFPDALNQKRAGRQFDVNP